MTKIKQSKQKGAQLINNFKGNDRKLYNKLKVRSRITKNKYFVKYLISQVGNTKSETAAFGIISKARDFANACNREKALISFKNRNQTIINL